MPAVTWWVPPPVASVASAAVGGKRGRGEGGDLWAAPRLAAAVVALRGAVVRDGATAALRAAGVIEAVQGASADTLTTAMGALARLRQTRSVYASAVSSYSGYATAKGFPALPLDVGKLRGYFLFRVAGTISPRGARAGELIMSSGLDDTLRHLRIYYRDSPGDWVITDAEYKALERDIWHLQYCLPAAPRAAEPVELEFLAEALAATRGGDWAGRRLAAWVAACVGFGLRGEEAHAATADEIVLNSRGAGLQMLTSKTLITKRRPTAHRRAAPHLPLGSAAFCVSARLIALHGPDFNTPAFAHGRRPLFPSAEAGPGAAVAWPVDEALDALRVALAATRCPPLRLNAHWGRASTAGLYFGALRPAQRHGRLGARPEDGHGQALHAQQPRKVAWGKGQQGRRQQWGAQSARAHTHARGERRGGGRQRRRTHRG